MNLLSSPVSATAFWFISLTVPVTVGVQFTMVSCLGTLWRIIEPLIVVCMKKCTVRVVEVTVALRSVSLSVAVRLKVYEVPVFYTSRYGMSAAEPVKLIQTSTLVALLPRGFV